MRYLVALRKVRVEIVLAVEFREARNVAVQSESRDGSEFHVAFRNARHGTRESETDRADAGVRHSAVAVFARAERLCLCQKLRVNLAADYDFIFFYSHLYAP